MAGAGPLPLPVLAILAPGSCATVRRAHGRWNDHGFLGQVTRESRRESRPDRHQRAGHRDPGGRPAHRGIPALRPPGHRGPGHPGDRSGHQAPAASAHPGRPGTASRGLRFPHRLPAAPAPAEGGPVSPGHGDRRQRKLVLSRRVRPVRHHPRSRDLRARDDPGGSPGNRPGLGRSVVRIHPDLLRSLAPIRPEVGPERGSRSGGAGVRSAWSAPSGPAFRVHSAPHRLPAPAHPGQRRQAVVG